MAFYIEGVDAATIEPRTSLVILGVGNSEATARKLIMCVSEANEDTIQAVEELGLMYNLYAAKFYFGVDSDILVILYLGVEEVLTADDLKTITWNVPNIVPFRPLNTYEEEEGLLWMGDSHSSDSLAQKLL